MAISERMFDREERELLALWQRAEMRLRRIVYSVKATDFQRARARALLSQVEAAMRDLRDGTDLWLARTLPKAFAAGFRWKGSGFSPGDMATFGTMETQAVEALAASIASDCAEAIASVAPGVRNVFVYSQQAILKETELMELVAQEIIQGQGPAKLARNIAATLRDGATSRLQGAVEGAVTPELTAALEQTAQGRFISIVCKDGKTRRYRLRDYADTVARTSTRMAQSEGTLRSCQDLGVDLVQISVHSNPCLEHCAPVQGKIYSISGNSADFPALTAEIRPPLHPKCRHVILPAPEDYLRGRGVYDAVKDFSNSDRQVGNAFDYRDLLQRERAAA